jgi:hypothetical protein
MKNYQPTRMQMAFAVWVIVMQMIALVAMTSRSAGQAQSDTLVVIDPANTVAMRYAQKIDLAEGLARYDQVILALEDYRADTGGYPATLELLVPNYLATSPAIYFSYGEQLKYDPAINGFDGSVSVVCLRSLSWRCIDAWMDGKVLSGQIRSLQ